MNEKTLQDNAQKGGIAYSLMLYLMIILSLISGIINESTNASEILKKSLGGIASTLAIFLTLLIMKGQCKNDFKNMLLVEKTQVKYYAIAILFSVSMFFGLGFINTVITNFLQSLSVNASSVSLSINTKKELIIFIIVFALLPAIFEELFFRGMILGCLRGGGLILSSLVSSLVFSLYHCSVAQLVYQFVYGLGLALLVKMSKSILPSILSHFLNNFSVIMLEYLKIQIDLTNDYYILGGIIGLGLFIFICIKIISGKQEKRKKGVHFDFFMPFGLFGILICISIIIAGMMI